MKELRAQEEMRMSFALLYIIFFSSGIFISFNYLFLFIILNAFLRKEVSVYDKKGNKTNPVHSGIHINMGLIRFLLFLFIKLFIFIIYFHFCTLDTSLSLSATALYIQHGNNVFLDISVSLYHLQTLYHLHKSHSSYIDL